MLLNAEKVNNKKILLKNLLSFRSLYTALNPRSPGKMNASTTTNSKVKGWTDFVEEHKDVKRKVYNGLQ